MSQPNNFNEQVINEFRANQGKVGGPFEGAPLLLLHTTGARSGQLRVSPVMYLPDGNRYVVFASKAGADTHPDWYHNLRAHPEARIEVGDQTLDVQASEIQGDGPRHAVRAAGRALPRLRRLPAQDHAGDPGRGPHRAGRRGPLTGRRGPLTGRPEPGLTGRPGAPGRGVRARGQEPVSGSTSGRPNAPNSALPNVVVSAT